MFGNICADLPVFVQSTYDVLYNVCNIPPGIYKHIYSVDKWMNVSVRGKNGKEGIVNMKQEVVVPTEYESVYHRETTGPNQMYYKVYNYGADEGVLKNIHKSNGNQNETGL